MGKGELLKTILYLIFYPTLHLRSQWTDSCLTLNKLFHSKNVQQLYQLKINFHQGPGSPGKRGRSSVKKFKPSGKPEEGGGSGTSSSASRYLLFL